MKSKLILLFLSIFFFIQGCKKENLTNPMDITKPATGFIEQARIYLASNYTAGSLSDLSIDASILYKLDSGKYIIRVPLKKEGVKNFILISTDSIQGIKNSALLQINKISNTTKGEQFSGSITIKELNGRIKEVREIIKGFRVIKDNEKEIAYKTNFEAKVLPEVVVISYIDIGIGWSEWYNMLSLSAGNGGGWYGFNYAYGPSGSGGPGSSYEPDPNTIKIEFSFPELKDPIDVSQYLKCFESISENGAIYEVKLLTDIPVNGNPDKLMDWTTGSPGHTFLQIIKTNGSNSIQQNIGFYPDRGWKSMLYAPVTNKLVNDQGHEFNASITMKINTAQFIFMEATLNQLSKKSYDIDDFNCTDFALQVFNSVRNNPLVVPEIHIPGAPLFKNSMTPQGIYKALTTLKNSNSSEANNIVIPGILGWAGSSPGPCN